MMQSLDATHDAPASLPAATLGPEPTLTVLRELAPPRLTRSRLVDSPPESVQPRRRRSRKAPATLSPGASAALVTSIAVIGALVLRELS